MEIFSIRDAKRLLVDGLQRMGREKDVISDTHGNLSVRYDMEDGRLGVLIKPSGVPFEEIDYSGICYVVPEEFSEGWVDPANNLRPSVDTMLHADVYRKNPHVRSICHTHSPYATAFAIAELGMDVYCTEHADIFGTRISVIPCFPNMWGFDGIRLSMKEKAILLSHHGVVTFGESPDHAVELAIQLESIAKKVTIAHSLSRDMIPLIPLDPLDIVKWNDRYNNRYGQKG